MKILNFKNYIICLLFTIFLLIIRTYDPFFVETARLKSFDFYQRGQEKVDSDSVCIIEIDEASLDKNGQWPWPRNIIADSVVKAYESGAALVVLPILYAEEDRLKQDDYLIDIMQQVPVVLGQSASTKGKGTPVPRGISVIGSDIDNYLFDYPEAIGPVKKLGESAAGVGMLATAPELDGVVRRMPLVIQIKGKYYPTLALEVLRLFGGEDSYQVKADEAGILALRVYGMEPIKTDFNSRVWLNYKYNIPTISFIDEDWSKVQDKIVFISPAAEGLTNTVPTALGTKYSQFVHATTLQMMIDESRLERQDEFIIHELMVAAAVSALIIITALWLPYIWSLCTILVSIFLLPYIGNKLFESNLLYDFTWPIFTIFVTWSFATFVRFVQENKSKRQIKGQFEHYLAPSIVKLLQKDPSKLQLGGDTKELSILFSDLRDFTSISEKFKSNPQGLTKLINEYLTPMTGSVIKYQGTVDKFIGDALMAFWNAPLDDKEHRINSIRCALDMFDLLTKVNKDLDDNSMTLRMGIGINSGDVVVGNMGSTQRFDYTCLGDAVNLAARLEGQTKNYKVGILLGEKTIEGIEEYFNFVELDTIAVKGKEEGIKIYTLLSDTGLASHGGDTKDHEMFLHYYKSRIWDEAIKMGTKNKNKYPELSEYYTMMMFRIDYLKEDDPGEGWDAIYRLTTK
jgi:adenylate cyclase